MKKVIVTGSGGFIGKALVHRLESDGVEVTAIDRRSGIEALDWFNSHSLEGIDTVFHLAAQTSVFNPNHTDIIRDNIILFTTVCDKCRREGVKLVYASSSTAAQGNTTSLYGISKKFNEAYARCYNTSATGVRFHNVYGSEPRQGTLLWHLLNDGRVKLYNLGRNRRHFTYLPDIIDGLIYASCSNDAVLNVCNPQICSVLEFATLVKRYQGIDFELVEESRDFDIFEQRVDEDVKTIPLRYRSVAEGIHDMFYKIYK